MAARATDPPLGAAVSAAIAPQTSTSALATLGGPSAAVSSSALILQSDAPVGEKCWIPAVDAREAQEVVDEIIIDRALVSQRRSVPIAFEAMKEIVKVREAYIEGAMIARANWEAANKVVTPEIAEAISKWRDSFRMDLRRRYPVSGFVAKSWEVGEDVIRAIAAGEYVSHAERVDRKRAQLLAAGKHTELIESALASNARANKVVAIAKSGIPVAKALAVGGTIVTAAEIPYRVYRLQIAKDDKETDEALARLIDASAAGAIAAACIAFGVTTAGIGLLACGVAPVAAGIFAGDAAIAIRDMIRP